MCIRDRCRAIADFDWSPITGGLPVTASIGVAVAPADGSQSSDLLRTADMRLYVAKRDGRNRVVHSATVAAAAAVPSSATDAPGSSPALTPAGEFLPAPA